MAYSVDIFALAGNKDKPKPIIRRSSNLYYIYIIEIFNKKNIICRII
jgi:hypothetical protein